MTSIHTNMGAMIALQTLRSHSAKIEQTQTEISSGLRVSTAADNAAYWSVATTMRSDTGANLAVADALGISASIVDLAYSGLEATIEAVENLRNRLIASLDEGVDKGKLQAEIRQLAAQTVSIANSSSFAGVNWLKTDVFDMYETTKELRQTELLSAFMRDGQSQVKADFFKLDLLETSLFNKDGGGILDGDPRSPKTVGGLRARHWDIDLGRYDGYDSVGKASADPGQSFTFAGPLTFTNPGDQVSFTLIVDADNPVEPGLAGPYSSGISHTIVIDRSTVDAALPGANGVVQDYYEMQDVLSVALAGKNAYSGFVYDKDTPDHTRPNMFTIYNNGSSPLNGSSFEIRDLTSTIGGFGGLTNVPVIYGPRASNIELTFEKFKIYKDVALTFDFSVNNQPAQTYSIDRTIVDGVLGTTDGWVNTSEDMLALLQSVVTWPDLEFTVLSPSKVKIDLPASVDRNAGYGTNLQITSLAVNVEPLPELGVLQIDIEAYPDRVYDYLDSVDGMLSKLTDGAATLGALARRIELQQDFVTTLVDTIEKGVGLLVDTDMEQSSARAKALQAQEQLSLQALSIANDNAANIAQLFR